ncbi:MAG: hypothetical protein ACHQVK_02860 [Candidatus Paceibacterales bacterium]
MTQHDSEIKTISQKTVSRDFVSRDLMTEEKVMTNCPDVENNTEGEGTRREVLQNSIPALQKGIITLMRTVSVTLGKVLDKIDKS